MSKTSNTMRLSSAVKLSSAMQSSRDETNHEARSVVLARIRQANRSAAQSPLFDPAHNHRDAQGAGRGALVCAGRSGDRDSQGTSGLVDLFVERTADYRATVETATSDTVADAIAQAVRGVNGVLIPDGFDSSWSAEIADADVRPDPGAAQELDAIEAVVTSSRASVAETGTIVLDHSEGQGRRALTLVPDLHVCLVPASTIHPDVPSTMSALRDSVANGRPLTWISGPSATSDIELERVEGVHGPRRLHVIVVADA